MGGESSRSLQRCWTTWSGSRQVLGGEVEALSRRQTSRHPGCRSLPPLQTLAVAALTPPFHA